MLTGVAAHERRAGRSNVYNLGTDETIVVDDSIALITAPPRRHAADRAHRGRRGWTGDTPLILLDCTRIRALGWAPTLTIQQAIVRTLDWFEANPAAVVGAGGQTDERDLQPRAAAHLPRRRRHRSALVLRAARRLPRLRRDRQVRLHADPHGLPAALPDEVPEIEEVDDAVGDPAPDPARDAAPPLARETRSRSPRWPTSPPGPAWARRARSRSAC